MEKVYNICCGVDVHKKMIVVCGLCCYIENSSFP